VHGFCRNNVREEFVFLLAFNLGWNAQWRDLSNLSHLAPDRTVTVLLGVLNRFIQAGLSPKTLTEEART